MDNLEHNLIPEAGKVHLLRSEKEALKARVFATPLSPTPSPYHNVHFFFRMTGSFAALLLVVSVPLTYAAQNSAPGDVLHRFEIGILEHIEGALQLDPRAERKFHTERLEERLSELQHVQKGGVAITPEDTIAVASEIQEHAQKLSDVRSEEPEAALEELVKTAAIVDANQEILSDISYDATAITLTQEAVQAAITEETKRFTETEGEDALKDTVTQELAKNATQSTDTLMLKTTDPLSEQIEDITTELEKGDIADAFNLVTEMRVDALKRDYLAEPAEVLE